MVNNMSNTVLQHVPCIHPECNSSDAMVIYEENNIFSAFCFSCHNNFKNNQLASTEYGTELGIEAINGKRKEKEVVNVQNKVRIKRKNKAPISKEDLIKIKESSSKEGNSFRGINDETLDYFKVRTGYDEETGEPSHRYYPCYSENSKVEGIKTRVVEGKKFYTSGINSNSSMLFGEAQAKGGGKYVLLEAGEEDCMAAHQMLSEYLAKSRNAAPIDVVSSSIGETSCAAQVKSRYDFIDSYDNIIVSMDEDVAGQESLKMLLEVLPLNKTKIMVKPAKDANDCLLKGLEDDYVRSFYNAQKPRISGVAGISEIISSITDTAKQEKIPLPSFMNSVNKALAGGYLKSSFNIIAAMTSVGKSSVANELLYCYAESDIKVGLLSLEASKGYVGEQLFSLFLHTKLNSIEDIEEKVKIVEANKEDFIEFMTDKDGDSNLYILDDRSLLDGTDKIFNSLNKLVRVCGCDVLIIDVLSDLTDTMSNEEQADFFGRIKKMLATQPVCVIGIMHMRKPSDKRSPHDVSEFDIYGSSTGIKSAHTVLLLSRDKLAEDEDQRNTTRMILTKNRNTGRTGRMNDVFYDYKTGRLIEKTLDGNF